MSKIKNFPEYSPLDLGLKEEFLTAYKHSPPASADMVFNTLFGWRDFFNYRVSRQNGFIIVYFIAGGRMNVLTPLQAGIIEKAQWGLSFLELADALGAYCRANSCVLEFLGVPELYLRQVPSGKFNVSEDRDYYDYIYSRSDLEKLEGRAFAPKRNLIRQFEKNYAWSYEVLTQKNVSACRKFLENWDIAAAKNGILGAGAYCMACRLIENFGSIELYGGMLYAEGKIVAASVGTIEDNFVYEDGPHSTVIVHHENGLTEYKGVYQMINRLFVQNLPETVVYVNREEDLGLAGLRKAKMSYNPVKLLKKSRLTLL